MLSILRRACFASLFVLVAVASVAHAQPQPQASPGQPQAAPGQPQAQARLEPGPAQPTTQPTTPAPQPAPQTQVQLMRSPDPYDPYESGFNWRHGNVSLDALVGIGGTAKLQNTPLALDITLGVVARYEHPINPYIVLGLNFGVAEWVPSASHARGAGRSTLFDFSFLPKLRYPFSDRFEIYLAAPVGFCADLADNSLVGGTNSFAGGYTAQAFAGLHMGLFPSTGLVLDGGYSMHWFSTHVQAFKTGTKYVVDAALAQPTFIIGFYVRN